MGTTTTIEKRLSQGTGALTLQYFVASAADFQDEKKDLVSVEPYVVAGTMTKRATTGKNRWAKRHLVLNGTVLGWWKTQSKYERGDKPKNCILIDDSTTVHDSSLRPLCIEVR